MDHKELKQEKFSLFERRSNIPNSIILLGDFDSEENALVKLRALEEAEEREKQSRSLLQTEEDLSRSKRWRRLGWK